MYSYLEPCYQGPSDYSPRLYGMTPSGYLALGNQLVSGDYINILSKYKDFSNFILSCKVVPFDVSRYFNVKEYIRIANVTTTISAEMTKTENITSGIAEFNFSRENLDSILNNSFIDYNSFSYYSLYLPFVGMFDLTYDTIKDCNMLIIYYYCDFSTCTLFCNVEISYGDYRVRIYEKTMDIGHNLPLITNDNTPYYSAMLAAIGTAITVGGVLIGNPLVTTTGISTTVSNVSPSTTTTTKQIRNPATNRLINNSRSTTERTGYNTHTESNYMHRTQGSRISATGELLNGVSHFISSAASQHCLVSNNESGVLNSLRVPYIMYKHPVTNYFNGYDHMYGRPLSQYRVLSSMSGFTKLSSIHLNIPATMSELEEIESLLYEGVIINNGTPTPEPPIDPEPPIEPEPPDPEPDPEPDPKPDPEPPEEYRPYEEGKEMICCFNGRFRVTSPRGWRTLNGVRDYHKGIDLVGEDSHVVYAICDGYCTIRTQYNDEGKMDGFGHYVTQTIADGRRVFYAHLASFSITDNQYVTAGTPIGIMGATGNVTGAHTHLELRPAGTTSESLDINAFTGIPNVVGDYTGVPTYAVAESAELQAKVGLENQTMEYLNNYEYAPDLIRKLNDKIE